MTDKTRSRSWVFTINNFTDQHLEFFDKSEVRSQAKYAVYGKERGQKGTPHLQGFMYFHNAKTFKQAKGFFPEGIHLEVAKGTAEQAAAYCKKDNDYIEFGEAPRAGKRTDLDKVKKGIEEGRPINEVISQADSYQAAKYVELRFKYQSAPPPMKRNIIWLYGETGAGKTKYVYDNYQDIWISSRNLKWWDGYFGQETVLFDDFRKDFCTFHELLRILDRYPFRVEFKGGSMWIQPTTKNIVITSCYHPQTAYETREDVQQLIRRIDLIIYFSKDGHINIHGKEIQDKASPKEGPSEVTQV